jgi:Phospholipase_D-nuclease N-terminal
MGTVPSVRRDHRPSIGARRRWRDLSGWDRAAIVTLGPVELALKAIAALGLYCRPQDDVRGAKALWWPAIFIQPIGPIAYLVFGRRD